MKCIPTRKLKKKVRKKTDSQEAYRLSIPRKVWKKVCPTEKILGHVEVVGDSKCSHVWMGRGKKGTLGARQGAENGAV